AKGRPVDRRTDIFAFGCALYEMLTGKRAFEGEDVSDTLAAVLRAEPDWSALPQHVPPGLRTLIQRCLAKDRANRIAEISFARLLLSEPDFVGNAGAPAIASRAAQRRLFLRTALWIGAVVLQCCGRRRFSVGAQTIYRLRTGYAVLYRSACWTNVF